MRTPTKTEKAKLDINNGIIHQRRQKVSIEEIARNDYNLNISRYVSTSVDEAIIDLNEVNQKLVALEQKITEARDMHNSFLKELKLPPI